MEQPWVWGLAPFCSLFFYGFEYSHELRGVVLTTPFGKGKTPPMSFGCPFRGKNRSTTSKGNFVSTYVVLCLRLVQRGEMWVLYPLSPFSRFCLFCSQQQSALYHLTTLPPFHHLFSPFEGVYGHISSSFLSFLFLLCLVCLFSFRIS